MFERWSPVASPEGQDQARGRSLIVSAAVLIFCTAYAAGVGPGELVHFDHALYEDTIRYQHAGDGYYEAHVRAFADRQATFSEVRSVRQPLTFWIWSSLPFGWLWPTYAIVVVGGIAVALQRVTPHQFAVLPVVAYLLMSGRIPSELGAEQWLLVELWALLPLSLSLAFWRAGRHAPAATAAVTAVLMRETTAGFLLVALLLAWWAGDRSARRAWSLAALVAIIGYALHVYVTLGYLAESGDEAALFGSADGLRTVWNMIAWMIPGPDAVGVILVLGGMVHLVISRRDLIPALGLFALAATGLLVNRPYWGFLFVPFGLLLFFEAATDLVARARQANLRLSR